MAENRVATVALEVLTSGDGSTARAGDLALEVLSSGPGSSAQVGMLALQVLSSVDESPLGALFTGEGSLDVAFAPIPKRLHADFVGEGSISATIFPPRPYLAQFVGEGSLGVVIHQTHSIAVDFSGEGTIDASIAPTAGGGSYTHLGGSGNRRGIFTITTDLGDDAHVGKLVNGVTTSELLNFGPDSGDVAGKHLTFEFNGSPRIITGVKLYVNGSSGESYSFQGFDGSDWIPLATLNIAGAGAAEVLFSNNTPYQSYRLLGVSGTQNGFRTWYEIEFMTDGTSYDAGDRTGLVTITSDLVLGTAGAGDDLSVSVDGVTYDDDEFDADGRWWFSGSGQAVAGKEVRFVFASPIILKRAYWQSGYDGAAAGTGTWKWQGSLDGSTWVDLGGSFVWTSNSDFNVDTGQDLGGNTTAYPIYRMVGVSGNASGGIRWNEVVFDVAPAPDQKLAADFVGEGSVRVILNRPPFIPFVQSVVVISGT